MCIWQTSNLWTRTVNLHIDNLAAQTGASLFYQEHQSPYSASLIPNVLERPSAWKYSKAESVEDFSVYTHLLTEDIRRFVTPSDAAAAFAQLDSSSTGLATLPINTTSSNASEWEVKYCVLGFDGWQRGGKTTSFWRRFSISARLAPKLWILCRKGSC